MSDHTTSSTNRRSALGRALFSTSYGGLIAAVSQLGPVDARADSAVMRLDAAGNMMWFNSFGVDEEDDWAVDVSLTPQGSILALRNVRYGGFGIVMLDANGDLSSFGTLPVTSFVETPPSMIAATVAYDDTNDDGLRGDIPTVPAGYSPSVVQSCADVCSVTGAMYGVGTAGSSGLVPQRVAHDGLCVGATPTLDISKVIGGASGVILLGFNDADLPALGGTLLVSPMPLLVFPVVAGSVPGIPGASFCCVTLPTRRRRTGRAFDRVGAGCWWGVLRSWRVRRCPT